MMLNLFNVRKQKKDKQLASDPSSKESPGQLRALKDLQELSLPNSVRISRLDCEDVMNYHLAIVPDEGFYQGGLINFTLNIPPNYPHDPPKLRCISPIYHPNIDQEGKVCLNILREDWKPVLTINSVIYGLLFLLYEPNYEDPLNKDAANDLQRDKRLFQANVRKYLQKPKNYN